jgi:hypothetical protein
VKRDRTITFSRLLRPNRRRTQNIRATARLSDGSRAVVETSLRPRRRR